MKIESITLTHVRVPLVEPFRISSGVVAKKDAIIVAVTSGGLTGLGESSPMAGSFYSSDTPESTWDDLATRLIPAALRAPPGSLDDFCDLIDASGCNPFARAGVETALWDLEAQARGIPLWSLLGGEQRPLDSGLAVGITPTPKELLVTIERYLVEGYQRIKIKIQPGWDVEIVKEVRSVFGTIPLMVDANSAYARRDISHLRALDRFALLMIEQPLPKDDLEGHAQLQSNMSTPLCLDEGATDCPTVQRAIAMGCCRIVNIKIQRVGGFRQAVRMHDLCARLGVPVWAGTMPELGIGGAQTLHLATLANFAYPTDVAASLRWFVDDIVRPLLEVKEGRIHIPAGTGTCYGLDAETVRRYRVESEVFTR